eukprot:scaffold49683_cov37-Prasinocladus_malaysianus.AAC.1
MLRNIATCDAAELQLKAQASGAVLGSSETINIPYAKAAFCKVILRRTFVYDDDPLLHLIYVLADSQGRSRVQLGGLSVSASIDDKQSQGSCTSPDQESGAGYCTIQVHSAQLIIQLRASCCAGAPLLMTFFFARAQLPASTFNQATASVGVRAVYGSNEEVVGSAQVRLAQAPAPSTYAKAGIWAELPATPRFPCQTFEVQFYANSVGADLNNWSLKYIFWRKDIITLLDDEVQSIKAKVGHLRRHTRL